jgi:Tol biopolymer transport system component
MPELREVFELVKEQIEPNLDSWTEQERRHRRASRNRRLGAFALVAMLGVLAAVFAIQLLDDDPPIKPAVLPEVPPVETAPGMYAVDLTTGEDTFIRGVPASPADASLDGSAMAFGRDAGGSSQIFIAAADGTQVQQVTHDPVEATDAAWSPDESEIAYVGFGMGGTDRSVFVVDLSTGRSRQLTDERADAANPAWSPDGTEILYRVGDTSADSELRVVNVLTGEVRQLTDVGEAAADGAWSPNGSTIAFALDVVGGGLDDSHGIVLMDAEGGNRRVLVRDVPAWGPAWSPDGTRIAYFAEDDGTCCNTYVIDVATGETRPVSSGGLFPVWLDDEHLIVVFR